jgi:hypothetical protein
MSLRASHIILHKYPRLTLTTQRPTFADSCWTRLRNDVSGPGSDDFRRRHRSRRRPREGRAKPAQATMLGTRLQRTAVLDLQQLATTPAREVGPGRQGHVPQLPRRIHQDYSAKRPLAPRQVQAASQQQQLSRMLEIGSAPFILHHFTSILPEQRA